jgi:type IV secretory pathway VirD2 relaxase
MDTKGFGLRTSAACVAHSVHSPRAIVGDNIGHVLVRGIDDRGKDLIIAREYISRGLAGRAAELVNLDLGPRTDREIFEGRQREIMQERLVVR